MQLIYSHLKDYNIVCRGVLCPPPTPPPPLSNLALPQPETAMFHPQMEIPPLKFLYFVRTPVYVFCLFACLSKSIKSIRRLIVIIHRFLTDLPQVFNVVDSLSSKHRISTKIPSTLLYSM